VDDVFAVQVLEGEEELLDDFYYLFLFEGSEFAFECEERIFCEFHDQVEVGFGGVEVVKFYDVVVPDVGQQFDLPEEVLLDLLGVLLGD